MTTCTACDRRLGRGAALCASCGRAVDPSPDLYVELEHDTLAAAHDGDLVLKLGRRMPPAVVGFEVACIVALVTVSLSMGGRIETGSPTTTTNGPRSSTTSTAGAPTPSATGAAATPLPQRIRVGPLLGEPTGLGLVVVVRQGTYRVDLDAGTVVPMGLLLDPLAFDITPLGLFSRSSDGVAVLQEPGREAPRSLPEATYLGTGPAGRAWFRQYLDDAGELVPW